MKKVLISSFSATVLALALVLGGAHLVLAAPLTPENVVATSPTPTTVNLSWSASTDAVFYEIFRDSTASPIATTTGLSYVNTGLTPSTTYVYYLAAVDASSTVSELSSSTSVTTLADTAAPSAPANLRAILILSNQINLAWNASTDNVGVVGYKVYLNGATTSKATVVTPSYSDTGLNPSTVYTYQVGAIDAAGNESQKSNSTLVTTLSVTSTSTSTLTREQVRQIYSDALNAATQAYDAARQAARNDYDQSVSIAQANLTAALDQANLATSTLAKFEAICAANLAYRNAVTAAKNTMTTAINIAAANMKAAKLAAAEQLKINTAIAIRNQREAVLRQKIAVLEQRRLDAIAKYESDTGEIYTGSAPATTTVDKAQIQSDYNSEMQFINQTYQDSMKAARDAYNQAVNAAKSEYQASCGVANSATCPQATKEVILEANQKYREALLTAQENLRTEIADAVQTMRTDRQAAVDTYRAGLTEWAKQYREIVARRRVTVYDDLIAKAQQELDNFLFGS